ncbi:GntR family transcriptional regulator [Glycomyces tarimensis]
MTDQSSEPSEARSNPASELTERRRIAEDLRDSIRNGKLQPGAKLPSRRNLAAQYGVVPNTAGEAIKILEAEGLVVTRNKARAVVREKPKLLRLGAERYSNRLREETGLSPYRAEVQRQGKSARVDCTAIERVQPPPEIAERLDVAHDEESVVRRENWYYADDEPVQVGVTYIPWEIAERTVLADSADMGKGSLYARFEDRGHRIASIREEISSRMPDPDETERLSIPAGVPVIEVVHTGIDQDDRPFEVTCFTMRADLNGLDYRIRIED